MCYFITATLPKTAPLEALDALARKLGRQFQPLVNPVVSAQLPSGAAYFATTLGHCDCGTVLGSARRARAHEPDWSQEKSKLLKKGWSVTKIARALKQRQQSREKAGQGQTVRLESFVSGIIESGLTTELGLLLHSYSGGLDESFRIRLEQVSNGPELASFLPSAQEDVLYLFRAGA